MPRSIEQCISGETTTVELASLQEELQPTTAADSAPIADPSNADHEVSAWQSTLIVGASFILVFTCCGCNFAFGVYQALYQSMSQQPDTPFTGKSPAEIDLIGTISISLMTLGAPLVVQWAKRFSPRNVSLIGTLVFSIALELASFGKQLWHFELTQGLMLGMGTCMCYMVAATVTPSWFTSHRGLAMGIVLSGTGIGGLVWAPALQASNTAIGFRNTLRWSGGICFVLCGAASFAMEWDRETKTRLLAEQQSRSQHKLSGLLKVPLVNLRVARSRRFVASALGAIFQSAAYYTPIFFFAAYASTLGYSDRTSTNFIAINNACNAVGKIVIGHAADRVGRLNALLISTLLSAAATLAFWLPSTIVSSPEVSRALFVTFSITYGLFASAYVSLFPTSLVELFGVQHFASVNGFLYMVRGASAFVGTPSAGATIRTKGSFVDLPRSYEAMALLVSVLLVAATLSAFWVRIEAMTGQVPTNGKRAWKL